MSSSIDTLAIHLAPTYQGINPLMTFLRTVRGPENNFSGKNSVRLSTLNNLFNASWKEIRTGSGHKKFEHRVTKITIEFSNHQDPLDPGAAQNIAELIQTHINRFFYEIMRCPTRVRPGTRLNPARPPINFTELARQITEQHPQI